MEKDGDKEVVVDEKAAPTQTCTDEQRAKVKELIAAYVKAGPAPAPPNESGAPPPRHRQLRSNHFAGRAARPGRGEFSLTETAASTINRPLRGPFGPAFHLRTRGGHKSTACSLSALGLRRMEAPTQRRGRSRS